MKETKTSVFSNGMIWFGAAVSIAEILTGTYIAPLGFSKGLSAIILGHVIGGVLFYLAGLIGAKTEKSAMETVKISFGKKGSVFFSALNILQLVGWTAIMIVNGAAAANAITTFKSEWIWVLIIGVLIIFWIIIGFKNLSKINTAAVALLFVLTVVMSVMIFGGGVKQAVLTDTMKFGAAVELSAAMPLSWLPLISDYTRNAKKKKAAALTSTVTYFFASCWMYVIGLGASLFTGESDISKIMLSSGLGVAGLLIVIFSTVTTTFLDAYSAGVSTVSISKKINEKWAGVIVCVIGMVLAVFAPMTKFENFLYLIGSVFAPMAAILITDFFILKKDSTALNINWKNSIIWLIGFGIYRAFMSVNTPVGNTLPVMVIISLLCIIVNKLFGGKKYA